MAIMRILIGTALLAPLVQRLPRPSWAMSAPRAVRGMRPAMNGPSGTASPTNPVAAVIPTASTKDAKRGPKKTIHRAHMTLNQTKEKNPNETEIVDIGRRLAGVWGTCGYCA